MTVRFLLLRHAEAEGNAAGRSQGRADYPLTALGRRQAEALARAVAPRRPVALYASPATRARETAAAVARASGLEPAFDGRLHELDHGELDGRTLAQVRAEHGAFAARWLGGDIADLRFPGGETLREAQRRMLDALDAIAGDHEAGERGAAGVAVVSHNLALKALLAHALGTPLAAARRFALDLASLTVAERRPGRDGAPARWSVVSLNERCHLGGGADGP